MLYRDQQNMSSQNKQEESVWNMRGSRAQPSHMKLLMKLDLYEIDGLLFGGAHSAEKLGHLKWQSASRALNQLIRVID